MALVASIHAWEYCFLIISVDGATLKNNFCGTILAACTLDGNSKIVPLAFGVIDSQNDDSWCWFFQNLKAAFGERSDLVIVSDGHRSISKVISVVYNTAEHGLCCFHIFKNFKKTYKSAPI